MSAEINPPHIAKQVYDRKKAFSTPKTEQASKETTDLHKKIDDFITRNLRILSKNDENNGKSSVEKKEEIMGALFGIGRPDGKADNDRVSKISGSAKEEFDKLSKKVEELKKTWAEAYKDLKGIFKDAYNFYNSKKEEYAKHVDDNRLKPNEVEDPHPDNIKVSAAVSQNFGSEPGVYAQKFVEASKNPENKNLDMVLDEVDKKVTVSGNPDKEGPTLEPAIQKSVSTPRANKDAWKKSDNNNEKVKRVVIIINSGGDDFSSEANKVGGVYTKQTTEEYKSSNDPSKDNTFRADEIIIVEQPIPEESEQGITFKDKIEGAFKKAKEISDKAKEDGAKVEGIAHWIGHGAAEEAPCANGNNKLEDLRFREGSMQFLFLGNGENSKVSESDMKEWEKKYLPSYDSFIQSIHSCQSGAAIASNSKNDKSPIG